MKITNIHNLPQPIYDTVIKYQEKYSRGDANISVTQLSDPPRKVTLWEKWQDQITLDAMGFLHALDGQIVHAILENAAPDHSQTFFKEKRFFSEFAGWKVSGQLDVYRDGVISDYKRCAIASMYRGAKEEWIWQLNVLAELVRRAGYPVTSLEVVAWFKDWFQTQAGKTPDYPEAQVMTVPIPLKPSEEVVKWVENRVRSHAEARSVLPLCSDEERWNRGDKWAVVIPNGKKALAVRDNFADAETVLRAAKNSTAFIERRPGRPQRCLYYCNSSQMCDQWKADPVNPINQSAKMAQPE